MPPWWTSEFDATTHEVYAPYDGGADRILANPDRRAALASRYAEWLSRRPDGM